MVISKKRKYVNRKMMGVSMNAAEQETVQIMMSSGGFTSFSQFAKAKIFGELSENSKSLKDVEITIDNMRTSIERNHNRWVDTAKRLSGADTEPLIAAIYALVHMMAKPQDRAAMAQIVDMKLIDITLKGEGNGYRKT